MNVTEEYEKFVEAMSKYASSLDALISQNLKNHLFEAIFTFESCSAALKEATRKANTRLWRLADLLNKSSLDIVRANEITITLNIETKKIKEVKAFINDDFITKILKKYERMVVKEYISEYIGKIQTIYNMLYTYKKDNKKNDLNLPDIL
jgi:hypothetical protein